jgi:hypothetical protein
LCAAFVIALCTLARGQGLLGSGALLEDRAALGPSITHAWIVVPAVGAEGADVLHLPPRGILSERDGRVVGARPGDARPATALRSAPVAVAARDSHLAMVFTDPAGFPQANGRTLLTLSAAATSPGVWDTAPKGRPDSLPSLRADGVLLGFAGAGAGYCALYQGLTLNGADSSKLVLQLLAGSSWVDLPMPAELEAAAAEWFTFAPGSKPESKASWRLFAVPEGVGLLVLPPGGGPDRALGTLWTAKLTPPVGKTPANAQWYGSAVRLPQGLSLENVSALSAAGHVVITGLIAVNAAAHQGQMRVFTRPCDFPTHAWREVASVAAVSTDHAVVALDGVGRIAVLSSPFTAADRRDRDKQTLTEVSVGTGAIIYSGELTLTSPISRADYRMVAVILGYALGLVLIFLLRVPPADAVLLPEGYSLAEPGRRVVAGIIDIVIGLVIASRLLHMPFADAISPSAWWSEQGQAVLLTSIAIMIGLNTVLELLFARSIGKIVTGCQIALIDTVGGTLPPAQAPAGSEPQTEGPRQPGLGRILLRNLIKFALPPVALLGLLDASGRHRGDQLAHTAVVIEGVDDEEDDEGPDDEE